MFLLDVAGRFRALLGVAVAGCSQIRGGAGRLWALQSVVGCSLAGLGDSLVAWAGCARLTG